MNFKYPKWPKHFLPQIYRKSFRILNDGVADESRKAEFHMSCFEDPLVAKFKEDAKKLDILATEKDVT